MKAKISDHELWRSRIHDAWASFRKDHTHLARPQEGEATRALRDGNPGGSTHRS